MRSGLKSVVIVSIVMISGCAELDKMTREESMSYQGCIAGGVGAGMLGYIKYHGDKNVKRKIALLVAMGCVAGGVAGLEIGRRTQKYVDAENAAQEEIKRNSENIEKLSELNEKLSANIEEYHRQISVLKESNLSEEEKHDNINIIKKYIEDRKEKAEQSLQVVEREIIAANEQLQQFQAGVKRENLQAWKEKLAGLEREKQILSTHVKTLNAMDTSI